MKCIRMLTFIPVEEIDEIEKWEDSRINEKKELLAYELTALVHGEEEATKAKDAAKSLFSGGGDDSNMPTTEISADEAAGGIGILDLLVRTSLAPSKGEARRLVQQGGISIDGEKVEAADAIISNEQLIAGVKIKKGKKVFHRAIVK